MIPNSGTKMDSEFLASRLTVVVMLHFRDSRVVRRDPFFDMISRNMVAKIAVLDNVNVTLTSFIYLSHALVLARSR